MNPFRAKKISDHFSKLSSFAVSHQVYGVTVTFRGNQVYFDQENLLWAFLFHIAHAEHQESIIAEAEDRLVA
ncbi:MAG: hypothetical protein R8M46_01050 [Ghiorsea sp.]